MAYSTGYTVSLHGRRLGLQYLSSSQSGGARTIDLLVGAEAVRSGVVTETTGTNMAPFGISNMTTISSSAVFTLDPPIPGVYKTLVFNSSGTAASPIYMKTANAETILSTLGSSFTTLVSSQGALTGITLIGMTTASWAISGTGPLSTGSIRGATTT